MLLAAVSLAQMIRMCAPNVSQRTMSAVVSVESGGNWLAIHDNNLERSFSPPSTETAIAWANELLAAGHSIDIGLSQVNSMNLSMLRLTVRDAFDPCINLHAGARILGADYANASQRFGEGQYALRRALGAYNSGSLYAGQSYVDRILTAAGLPPEYEPPPAPVVAARVTHHMAPPSNVHRFYTAQYTAGSPVEVIVGTP